MNHQSCHITCHDLLLPQGTSSSHSCIKSPRGTSATVNRRASNKMCKAYNITYACKCVILRSSHCTDHVGDIFKCPGFPYYKYGPPMIEPQSSKESCVCHSGTVHLCCCQKENTSEICWHHKGNVDNCCRCRGKGVNNVLKW